MTCHKCVSVVDRGCRKSMDPSQSSIAPVTVAIAVHVRPIIAKITTGSHAVISSTLMRRICHYTTSQYIYMAVSCLIYLWEQLTLPTCINHHYQIISPDLPQTRSLPESSNRVTPIYYIPTINTMSFTDAESRRRQLDNESTYFCQSCRQDVPVQEENTHAKVG